MEAEMAIHEIGTGRKKKYLNDREYREYRAEHSGPLGCVLAVLGVACLGGSIWLVHQGLGLLGLGWNGWGALAALVLAVTVWGVLETWLKRVFFRC